MKIQKIPFYFRKWLRDQTNPLIYDVSTQSFSDSHLDEYYFLFSEDRLRAGGSQNFHFDDRGVPIIPTYADIEERRMHYYPIAIGQYGLAIYHTWLQSGNMDTKAHFLRIVEWFEQNQDASGYWRATVPEPKFGLAPGWPSAMAQGRGLNILLRGYQMTGNEILAQKAKLALESFRCEVKDGGILGNWNGLPCYEEYPALNQPHVLNGFIFALWGIWDYCRVFPQDREARQLWDEGIKTLKSIVEQFDIGYWTCYDLLHQQKNKPVVNVATQHYHWIHIRQMQVMGKITGDAYFFDVAKRWERYAKNRMNSVRASLCKVLKVVTR